MKVHIVDVNGEHDIDINQVLGLAQAAGAKHPVAYLNDMHMVAEGQPTASQQIYQQMGFADKGISVAKIMSGKALAERTGADFTAAAIQNDGSITGRLVTQAYLMDAIENKLVSSDYGFTGLFNSHAAVVDSISNTKFDRPILNFSKPEGARSRSIAQLSEPASMLSITVSDTSYKIPGTSIGMEYSDEALMSVSLPIITLAMTRQAEVENLERIEGYMLAFLNGDTDVGMTALSSVAGAVKNAKTDYDPTLAVGKLNQAAWIGWLFNNSRKRKISTVITDLKGAMAIANRADRPTVMTDNPTSNRIDSIESVVNPTWADKVDVIISSDPNWPANTIVGFDDRFGYHVVNSTTLSYSAMEAYAIRRATKMRIDSGSIAYRLFDDAWSVLTLN